MGMGKLGKLGKLCSEERKKVLSNSFKFSIFPMFSIFPIFSLFPL